MRLTFYAACVLSMTANALSLHSHTSAEDGLSSAIEVDPEFDSFMLSQTYSNLDVEGDEKSETAKAEAAKA